MCSLAKTLEEILSLLDTDQKQIDIANEPETIFLLGYNYSKIEKQISKFNFKEKLSFKELLELIGNEDFFKVYLYLEKMNHFFLDEISKYTL